MLKEFLQGLRRKGIKLWLSGETLKFKAYRNTPLNESDKETLRNQKLHVILWLKEHPNFFDYLPLSENQKSLWLVDCFDDNNTAYNLTHVVRLIDDLDLKKLAHAFELLCQRHRILRTAYVEIDDEALQFVPEHFTPVFNTDETYRLNDEEIVTWAKIQSDKPFNLTEGHVCRADVLLNRFDDHVEYIFQLSFHHIAVDYASCEVLFDELLGAYKNLVTQCASDQVFQHGDDLEHDYFDWSQQQRQWLTSDASAQTKQFWQSTLTNNVSAGTANTNTINVDTLELTTDNTRPSVQTYDGEELSFLLNENESSKLRVQAKNLGVTPFVFCLSIFQLLLYRYSGQTEFFVGTPTSGRLQRDYQRTVGYLVNPVVLRCDLRGRLSFSELVARVEQHSKAALMHQDLPFSALIELLDVPRDPSRTPLFQHMFTMTHVHPQDHADLVTKTFLSEQRGAAHDLNLVILDDRQTFTGKWRYNSALFSRQRVELVLKNYLAILNNVCQNPNISLSDIVLNGGELSQQIGDKNTQIEQLSASGALELFERQVCSNSENIALRCGDEVFTYQQLNDYAQLLALSFQQQGIKSNQCIGLCLVRGPELIASILALWKLGAAYAALDPEWPDERLQQLCDDGCLDGLIVQGDFVAANISIYTLENQQDLEKQEHNNSCISSSLKNHAFHPNQAAYYVYTSGSTGKPKAVCVTHQNIAHYALAVSERLSLPNDSQNISLMSLGSLATDLGHTAVYGALLQGHTLHLPTEAQAHDPVLLAQCLHENPVTYLKVTPSHIRAMSDVLGDILPTHGLILGGEALSTELLNHIVKTTAKQPNKQCQIINHYGPTETTVGVLTYNTEKQHPKLNSASSPTLEQVCPIGYPLANTDVYVLDADLNPVPIGVDGELYIGGRGLSEGYVGRPSLTSESFVPSPFSNHGERLYRSGDRVRLLHSGELHYIGRVDDQVKVRGFRVELGEIEHQLRQLDQVNEAVVVLHQHEHSASSQLLAYIQIETTETHAIDLNNNEFDDRLRQQLPEHMIPTQWQVIERFPRLSSGKINRRALPAPVFDNGVDVESHIAARNSIEKNLYDIWSRVLNRNDFGVTDSFFELGGDSILSLQIITQAKKIGIGLTPKVFFEARTIEALAQRAKIKENKKTTKKSENLFEQIPLTPIQHWFFESQKNDVAHWNQSLIFSLKQAVCPDKFRAAVVALISHHDALRLAYTDNNEQKYTQVNEKTSEACFVHEQAPKEYVTKSSLFESDWFNVYLKHLQSGFNLQNSPLFKLALVEFPEKNESIIVMTAHHLIVDGVSWRIILEDLETLYQSAENTDVTFEKSALEKVELEKTDSYLHWSRLLEQQVSSGAVKEDYTFWSTQYDLLKNGKKTKDDDYLSGYVYEKNTVADSECIHVSLDRMYTSHLLGEAPNAYRLHVNECLVAALVPVLDKIFKTDGTELPIEFESHGRDNRLPGGDVLDVSKTVGWFTARYPLLIQDAFTGWPSTISDVKNRLRSLPNNGISYGMCRYLHQNLNGSQDTDLITNGLMTFNYLGQIDGQLARSDLFDICEYTVPYMRSEKSQRTHIVDVNMHVINGQLHMEWTYPKHCLNSVLVRDVAEDYRCQLMALLDHCLAPNAGEVDVTDFDDVEISGDEFDSLLDELA